MKLRTLLLSLLSLATIHAEPFKDGDRWEVVGDSITQNGSYHAWVYLFYATRFPDRKLDVENGGISGDTAGGALQRYAWDIGPRKASVATVMFGMNDVSRGLYDAANPTPEILAKRESALEDYRKNLTELTKKLKADGTRVVLVTSSPFDETVDSASPRQTGVDGAIGKCADFMKKLASETGAAVIDLHGPLDELTRLLQAADPKATILNPDRIHPAAPGHFAMAYFFLKGQGAPGVVSEVDIDAASGKVTKAENATITGLTGGDKGIEFQCLEKALPCPVPDEALPALDWVPFQDDLNREILRVSGLKGDSYTILIDNQQIGDFKAEELKQGVNLAKLKNTPQARQAAGVLAQVKKWQGLSADNRKITQVEGWLLKDLPHPISFDAAKSKLELLLPSLDEKKDAYKIGTIKRYLQIKPNEIQTEARLAELANAIRSAARPVPHSYSLSPSGTPVAVSPALQQPKAERPAEIVGKNLLENPGLEDGPEGWGLGPPAAAKQGAALSVSSDAAHSGTNGLVISCPETIRYAVTVRSNEEGGKPSPGERFRVSAWVCAGKDFVQDPKTPGFYIRVTLHGGPGGTVAGGNLHFGLENHAARGKLWKVFTEVPTVWTQVSATFEVPEETTSMNLDFFSHSGSGSLFLDDVSLEKVPVTAPLTPLED